MKKTFTLLFAAFLTLPALAQTPITLTQATFPAAAGTQEQYQDATIPTGLTSPSTGANQPWDYRTLGASGAPYSLAYLPVPASGGIAGAQWTRARQAIVGGFYYNYTAYYSLAATGRLGLGRTTTRQPLSIRTNTGGANDSVVINAQTVRYGTGTAGIVDFPLPLTVGSRNQTFFRFGVTGTLTVAAAGLNRAPFRIVQRYTYVDSVAGWGTVRIPVAGRSTGSGPLPVLLVRSRVIRQDSVYLNGAPAPAALLAAFGITQGAITAGYYDGFWRTGSAQPVAELYYPNRQYATPNFADYSTESTVLAARASSALAEAWQAWPNPLAAGQDLRLALPGALPGQPVQLTITNALGRAVLSQPLPLTGGTATLPAVATEALRPGLYLLTLRQGAQQATSRLLRE
ncbi:T9SS type A sorting domain-containing protein [Hymenobacter sp. M29]|uniref:T9SS type A sorting domain-containing protein n=1 Tax=Hymenobacter mellowenesis TaxID=3063995 RepID=A0ABT9A7H1_9BACT|nr:T9SS type A sorting domain-containing protein [Hymenobacter sp. M29]MDO7845790.1 T9SS type A sorting domain-containing protein [Hymenobacter sp. M29]